MLVEWMFSGTGWEAVIYLAYFGMVFLWLLEWIAIIGMCVLVIAVVWILGRKFWRWLVMLPGEEGAGRKEF
jgi:hypothetical protein